MTTPIDINTTTGANDLRNSIGGAGIAFIGNAIGVGSDVSAGTFTGGLSAGLDFDAGIVLTTGSVIDIIDSNNSVDITGAASLVGNASLDGLGQGLTLDSTSLTFDFQIGNGSTGGNLFFNFVFASDEYNEFVFTEVDDLFGFFVNGTNVALIPGTTTPVSIDNINLTTNSALFNNNGIAPAPFDFEFDGFTDAFQVQVLGLAPGAHTIELAIADVGDARVDSAVFIQAISFSDSPTPFEATDRVDINLDGFVGAEEFVFWRDWVGSNAPLPDYDGDGEVSLPDYFEWQRLFGAISPSTSFSAVTGDAQVVPEPGACLLLAGASWLAVGRWRCVL